MKKIQIRKETSKMVIHFLNSIGKEFEYWSIMLRDRWTANFRKPDLELWFTNLSLGLRNVGTERHPWSRYRFLGGSGTVWGTILTSWLCRTLRSSELLERLPPEDPNPSVFSNLCQKRNLRLCDNVFTCSGLNSNSVYLFFFFVVDFVIHWNETAMGLHVFPIPIPPPTSVSTRSL